MPRAFRVRLTLMALLGGVTSLLTTGGLQGQQTGTLTGRVTDAQSGQPIASVQVFIEGLDVGGLTQQNGRYLLQNVPTGTHTLSAERIGYRVATAEVTIASGETAIQDFALSEEALQLDEVIVTGTPGGTARRALGNSVASVEASEVTERVAISNMQEMLSARTPGLNFTRLSGNVGTGSSIQIRGFSSLELTSQPLVYVDGIRVNNEFSAGANVRGGGQASVLDDFNPNDIESIEVIKGPAAAALYGTEASAGVIQIITKKGQSGAPEFNLTVRQGANFMIDPAGTVGEQWGCEGGISLFFGTCAEENLVRWNIYDHEKNVNGNDVFGYGHTQGYNLGVRGGTDAVRYYLSGDWSDDNGIVSYNWDTATRLRANVSVVFSEALTVDVSTGFTDGETRFAQPHPSEGGVWEDMVWAQYGNLDTELRGFQERLPEDVATVENFRNYSRFTGSLTASHSYGDWLSQRFVVGLDKAWEENSLLVPRDELGASGPYSGDSEGRADLDRPNTSQLTVDYNVTGEYQLNETVGFATSVGAQYYTRDFNQVQTQGTVFSSPLIRDISGASQFEPVDTDLVQSKSMGVYVQEQVSINDRIFLTGALRGDDNSTFGSEFDLVYYPRLSAAWVLSEEPFWDLDFVNSFRLRVAWGEAGRQPDAFAATTTYSPYLGPGGRPALIPGTAGNPNIGPERSSEIEGGFDVAVLDDRVSGEFTYFHQKVTDALVDQTLPPSSGFPGAADFNLGEMENWGWEASLDARMVDMENVAFDLALTGAHSDNEVTALGEQVLEEANFRLGLPYPNVTSSVVLSAEFDQFGNATNIMCDGGTGKQGLYRGGDPVPCSQVQDRELLLGPAFPTYTWTVAPTLTLFNSLQLFALAEGSYGRWLANIDLQFRNFYRNNRKDLLRDDPLYVAAERTAGLDDDRYRGRYDADFWKMREVGLRYQLPSAWIQGLGADRASLSVSGRNLWIIWQKQKTDLAGNTIPDPELTNPLSVSPNFTLGQMPAISSASVTLRVSF